jgi:hypothetical protein
MASPVYHFLLGLFAMPFDDDQIPAKRHRLKHLDLYDVSGDELDNLEHVGSNVGNDLQFSTFWFPIGIFALLTLIAVPIANAHVYETYMVATFIGFGFGIYFGVRWWINRGQFKKCIEKIRQRQVGPVGQEGKELKPSELEILPAVAPPAEPPK